MKLINKLSTLALAAVIGFSACEKADELPSYADGTTPVLSTPSATIAPPVADSNKVSVVLNWTDPKFASDPKTFKYVIEIDSAGRNFSRAYTKTVIGKLTDSTIAKEFNNVMLAWGFEFNKAYDVDVRVTASYANNNEQKRSNILRLRATPYKVPPKVALPTTNRLFIVGDATTFGWSNENPTSNPGSWPRQRELTRVDETTWEGIFNINTGGQYLLLPTQGSWDNKFSVANNLVAGLANGGSFGFNLTDNFPANISGGNGWYKLTFDFQRGVFSTNRMTLANYSLPSRLWVTGSATNSDWTNTPPDGAPILPSGGGQEFTAITNGIFEITIPLKSTGQFKFLSNKGFWQPQFGGTSITGGALSLAFSGDADTLSAPATAGNYKITVNFINNTYTIVRVS